MELLINFRGRKVSAGAYKEYLACKARVEDARAAGLEPDPQDEYNYLNFLGAMTNSEKKRRHAHLKALKETK